MADLRTASATDALNEENYINKIYDSIHNKQKDLLKEGYTDTTAALNKEQQSVQKQTDVNLERTDVEAQKVQQGYKPQNASPVLNQQAGLVLENQKRKNTETIRDMQSEADAEIERQRLLMGQQYAAAIKQAQANNDMARAQQLYAAAKEKDAQFRAMKASAGTMMASLEDNSILESMLKGVSAPASSGETWADVLKHEDTVNKVYDSAIEADRQAAQMNADAVLSRLRAEQEAKVKATDKALTDAYVNALRQGKNYNEVQNTYGLGSGNKAQANLARATGLTGDLTALRGVQMGADARTGMQRVDTIQAFRDAVRKSAEANDAKRAGALYGAAADEETALVSQQQTVAKNLADQGDFTVLGKLYGLTDDQVGKLKSQWDAQEAAKKAAEEEARRKAEEAARKKAEAEAKKKAEEEAAKKKAEEEARKKAEAEAARKAAEEAARLAAIEAERKRAEEEARRKAEEEAEYTGWENQTLQNLANAGVQKYEENRTPLNEEQKKELTTESARDEMSYIKNAQAEARAAALAAAAAEERKAREAERRAAEEKRRELEEEAARQKAEEEARLAALAAAVAASKKNPGSARKPVAMKQFGL